MSTMRGIRRYGKAACEEAVIKLARKKRTSVQQKSLQQAQQQQKKNA